MRGRWPTLGLGLLFLVDDLGLLDDLLVIDGSAVAAAGRLGRLRLGLGLGLGVDGFGQLVRRILERLGLGPDLAQVVALDSLLQLHDPALDRRGLGLVEAIAVLAEAALGRVREPLGLVLGV